MSSFQNLFFQSNPQMHDPAFSVSFVIFLFFFFFIVLLLSFFSFSLHKTSLKHSQPGLTRNPDDSNPTIPSPVENNPTHVPLSEVSPSDSAKDATFVDDKHSDPDPNSSGETVKKKKRKAKKKKVTSVAENDGFEERENSGSGIRIESAWLYPFTSSNSAMQRRIKQQYDELVQCNESRKLKLAQVVQFANSLVEARGELQHKADVIRRKFVITKALLCKAERSSFDRLRQQIYKLELEQKRLEEDASVYNWLQQQLKLSPAYKKMLEIGASMEKENSFELVERRYDEFAGISFEELLAQEKKDSFWQKSGKSKLCSS